VRWKGKAEADNKSLPTVGLLEAGLEGIGLSEAEMLGSGC